MLPRARSQCPAFCLTGALRVVYRNVRWRSIQGFVPPFLPVSGPFVAAPGLFVAAPGLSAAVPPAVPVLFVAVLVAVRGLFVAAPGIFLAASRLCKGLSTACLGTEYIYEQPTTAASKKVLFLASRSFGSDLECPPS